jgi:hemolysin
MMFASLDHNKHPDHRSSLDDPQSILVRLKRLSIMCLLFLIVISSNIALCVWVSQVQAATIEVGLIHNPTKLSKKWIASNFWPQQYLQTEKDLLHTNIVLVNTDIYLSEHEINLASKAYGLGKILVFDNSDQNDFETLSSAISAIVGIGVTDTLVLVRKSANTLPEIKATSLDSGVKKSQAIDLLLTSLNEEIGPWLSGSQQNETFLSKTTSANYISETTLPLAFSKRGFKCRVGDDYQGNGFRNNAGEWNGYIEDACNGNASVSLFYTIDFIRSVPLISGNAQNIEDSKYVRITLDPKTSSGTGWHLVDKPIQRYSWYESAANRIAWFGPIAMNYGVTIKSSDTDVRLVHNIPNNTGIEQTVNETSGITVGVSAGASEKAGANVGANLSYSSSRAISYKTFEYEVSNLSRGDIAKWTWDRNFDARSSDWVSRSFTVLGEYTPFFIEKAFSPAAYANFRPGFSATFKVDGSKKGTSDFELSNIITISALSGRVQYAGLASTYGPYASKGYRYTFPQNFSINWDAPVFQPERNVSIEAFRLDSAKGLCITAPNEAGKAVTLEKCTIPSINQMWGYDKEQRYRSRVKVNTCLTLLNNKDLVLNGCSASAAQKWTFVNNQIMSNLGPKIIVTDSTRLDTASKDTKIYDLWEQYTRHPTADQVLQVK